MTDGNPPMTFVYGCPPPPRDEPKYIMPVMPRALEKFVTGWAADISKKLDALTEARKLDKSDAEVRHAKVEALLARINNQVTTINEFIAVLRAVKPHKRKRKVANHRDVKRRSR